MCSRIPSSSSSGAWVHSPEKVGRDVGELCGLEPLGVTATGDLDEICAIDADCVVYAPVLASTARSSACSSPGKNVVTPVGWIYPPESPKTAEIEDACRRGGTDAARHRHQPGRHHRAVPAHALGDVPRHPPRAGRGVLRHPQLPDRVGGARGDAVRHAAGAGGDEPDARDPRRRVHAVDRHDRGRARLDARPGEAHDARDGGRDRDRSTRRSVCSRRARSPRSASRGRGSSTASRSSRCG